MDLLEARSVDYYFDREDVDLQLADEQHDHLKVVHCIENGLAACTHLLGIITEHTKDSWWVPYEIGSATGRQRECAHLIDGEVDELPSYIQAAEILPDQAALQKWLPKDPKSGFHINASDIMEALLGGHKGLESGTPSFVPAKRALDELAFY